MQCNAIQCISVQQFLIVYISYVYRTQNWIESAKISFIKANVLMLKYLWLFDWKCELFCKILWFIGSASNRLISYWKWPVYAISQTQLNLTEILIIIGESNCHYFHPNRNGIVIIAFADPYCNSNVITAQIFAEAHATRRW